MAGIEFLKEPTVGCAEVESIGDSHSSQSRHRTRRHTTLSGIAVNRCDSGSVIGASFPRCVVRLRASARTAALNPANLPYP